MEDNFEEEPWDTVFKESIEEFQSTVRKGEMTKFDKIEEMVRTGADNKGKEYYSDFRFVNLPLRY